MILAVKTGLDSFLDPQEIGPMYPFVGTEVVLVIVALFAWLVWHFLQARFETREDEAARAHFAEIGLERAMYHGGSAFVATDEEWEEPGRHRPGDADEIH